MNVNAINYLSQAQYQSALSAQDGARDGMKSAMGEQKKQVGETYKQRMKKVAENDKARSKSKWGRFLGAAFAIATGGIGGLMISPIFALIGDGIAGLASKGNKQAANRAEELAGMHDVKYNTASDRFENAKKNLEDQRDHASAVARFSTELRDTGWKGIDG